MPPAGCADIGVEAAAAASVIRQQTIGAPITVTGAGLHTGRRSRLTLHPAAVDHGRRLAAPGDPAPGVAMVAAHRVPSVMSTSIDLGGGRTVRTIEHLMASLSAYGVDNVRIEVDGPEVPIFDGSARRWCRLLDAAGLVAQSAPRQVIRVLKPVQISRHGGFLRIEPADAFTADMTYDLLPAFPVMRWAGAIDRDVFLSEIADARSFGCLDWRRLLGRPRRKTRPIASLPQVPNRPDPDLLSAAEESSWEQRLATAKADVDQEAPVLRGARPGRAALVVGRAVLPWPRGRDEPVRHVALDMIGDLALAGAALLGHVTAHNPSHEKTYMLVAALMADRSAWTLAPAPTAGVSR